MFTETRRTEKRLQFERYPVKSKISTDLKDEEVTGQFSKALDDAVNAVKASEERRREYMILNMRENEIRTEGRNEGRIEGRKEGRKEGLEEGTFLTVWNLTKNGLMTIDKAAAYVGMSVEDFEKKIALYTKNSDERTGD